MSATKAQKGYLTLLSWLDETLSPPAYTKLAEVRSISGLGVNRPEIDVTHMESPDESVERISGLNDGKTVTVRLNTTVDNIDIIEGMVDAGVVLEWKLVTNAPLSKTRYFAAVPLDYDHGDINPAGELQLTMQMRITRRPSSTEPA